jgi:peptidoglycan/LPS O-acetylase OafA/YrhL
MDRSKSRFVALDGLRGLAAIIVVVWHAGATRFIPGGYLAVDLFFALSGFVLSHAYETRPTHWSGFMLARMIRLYPLYAAGTAFGAVVALSHLPADGRFWATLGANAMMLPSPARWSIYIPFPLNTPAWSLFFELLVNAAWFAALPKLSNRALAAVLVISALAVVGTIAVKGSVEVGDAGADFLPLGVIRSTYSFFAGAACYRVWVATGRSKSPLWIAPAVFITVIAAPLPRAMVDAVAVLAIFPAVIFVGASAQTSGFAARAMTVAGAASYAIYTLHAPLVAWAGDALWRLAPDLPHAAYWIAITCVPAVVVLSWLADRYFDLPLRSALSRRLAARVARSAAT